jgi:hypothetical protein
MKICWRLICWVVLLWPALSRATINTIDTVPAATLLLPYFAVDAVNAQGLNTRFAINNASAEAVLAHVTVWTDQSVPALAFDVYLTGYDMEQIDLRDVLINGNVPVTASAGQDPKDTISPQGPVSQDINFASCSSLPYTNPRFSAAMRAHFKAWFQGNQSPTTGNCAGSKEKDNILRGYVTVDTVNACNPYFPSDWSNYAPLLTNQNVLWGYMVYFDRSQYVSLADPLVHIEACPSCFASGDHTFYGRYNAAAAADAREPLPTTMAAPYTFVGSNSIDTEYFIWREANATASGYSCTLQGPPSWYPLESTQIVIFDREEQAVTSEYCPFEDPTCSQTILIPNEANRIDPPSDLLTPFNSGWAYLNLQHPNTPYADTYTQMWLMVAEREFDAGLLSVGFSGLQIDNANNPTNAIIPVP